jgi:hypothetical protein
MERRKFTREFKLEAVRLIKERGEPRFRHRGLSPASTQVEGGDRGHYDSFPAVHFEHFYGVSPRRYREIFERGKRKDDDGTLIRYRNNEACPILGQRF